MIKLIMLFMLFNYNDDIQATSNQYVTYYNYSDFKYCYKKRRMIHILESEYDSFHLCTIGFSKDPDLPLFKKNFSKDFVYV